VTERTLQGFRVAPGGSLRGRVRVPGDKSISHRAIMLGSIAEGETTVEGFLEGADALATLAACRAMGVSIEGPDDGWLRIGGVGLHGLRAPAAPLDLGNAGTAMRLFCGLLAGQAFDSVLTGDASLSARPMRRVIEPLTAMGAEIDAEPGGRAPLRIRGGRALRGLDYAMPMASAQVKSCLLLAGLYASGETAVTEPAPSRDHTERMLEAFGCRLRRDGQRVVLGAERRLRATRIVVPGDLSSAAFLIVGACIAAGADLVIEGVGINPTRTGVLDILSLMGADIELRHRREQGAEPVADIHVRSVRLSGITIPERLVPLAIDEFPILFIAAACATGTTVLRGAEELRVKESDRIAVMAEGLVRLGVRAEATADGMVIHGCDLRDDPHAPVFDGGVIDSHGDHRIAMAFAMAALRARAPIRISDTANVATSFPGFDRLVTRAGLGLEVLDEGSGAPA